MFTGDGGDDDDDDDDEEDDDDDDDDHHHHHHHSNNFIEQGAQITANLTNLLPSTCPKTSDQDEVQALTRL